MRSLTTDISHQELISVLINPGWMRTSLGGDTATQEPTDSARGIIRLTKQLHAEENGRFVTWQGQPVPQ